MTPPIETENGEAPHVKWILYIKTTQEYSVYNLKIAFKLQLFPCVPSVTFKPLRLRLTMSSSTLIEVFGHIVFSFTRGVTEHYNPEEPEFTAESFGYDPLQSTGREWYYLPVDELIYQEYSDREVTNLDYLASNRLDVRVINACSPEENEETHDDKQDEDMAMAWKRLRPSALRTVCKSMYIGALISLLTATIIGSVYMLIIYLCLKTISNCEFYPKSIPENVQWMRSISNVISCAFMYSCFFTSVMFRVLQADLDGLPYIAILGIIHGVTEVIERSAMVVIDHICHVIWKRKSAPWGSFRTPRRERLMADIAIMSMLSESTAIVSVNGFLYLYQFIYLQNESLLKLLQSFAIHTSVQLVIEWFFTSVIIDSLSEYGCHGCLAKKMEETYFSGNCTCCVSRHMDKWKPFGNGTQTF
ncbi:hypothetical protein ACROYT_G037876 [Oculina patagonica]